MKRLHVANFRLAVLAILLTLLGGPSADAQEGRRGGAEPREEAPPFSFGAMREDRGTETRLYDLEGVHLDVKLDEQARTIEGQVTNRIIPLRNDLREIWFDCVDLEIQSVSLGEQAAGHELRDERLYVLPPEPLTAGQTYDVIVRYRGTDPDRGLYFIQPSELEPELKYEIWTQGQAENNRYWLPTWDYPTDRAVFSGRFTVREGFTVVSNGTFEGTEPAGDGWVTHSYRLDFPFPTYLISVCVGDYESYVDHWRGIPVEYFVNRGVGEATARRSFDETPRILEYFSDATGIPYPYPKYSQVAVQNFVAGGMENISATTQSDRTLHDEREHLDRTSRGLVAHEAAHQWFGDLLTCDTWRHLWLNEGFATYFEALYTRHAEGEDDFRLRMRDNQRSALRSRGNQPRPMVETFFSRAPDGDGSNAVYTRGSSVLYMIHSYLGDDLWWKAIHYYLDKHRGELVDTQDFQDAIEEATGVNLHWLFDQYVYLPGHPRIEVQKSFDAGRQELVLAVKQTQDTSGMVPLFRCPVNIEVTGEGYRDLHVVWLEGKEQEIRLPAPAEPLMVCFDKGSALLCEVQFEKSVEELAYQALHDDDVIGRLAAVDALAEAGPDDTTTATLVAILASGDHEEVRAAAATGLGKPAGLAALAALRSGLGDPEPSVRRECARALAGYAEALPEERTASAEALAAALRKDLSYGVQASAAASLGKFDEPIAHAVLREATQFASPEDRVAAAALGSRIALRDSTVRDEVLALARDPENADRRRLGISVLGEFEADAVADLRPELVKLLLHAAEHDSLDGRTAAVRTLGVLRVEEARSLLSRYQEDDESFRLRGAARQALARLDGEGDAGGPAGSGPTAAEFRALKREVEELRRRLEALEAPAPPVPEPTAGG